MARDVNDEIAAHLELRRQELVAQGFSEQEAHEVAQRRFGNVPAIARACREIDERWYREQRRAGMWTDLRQDIGYAFRLLRRSPGFTAVAIITLALGIGATTAIFSVIDAAFLRPLPYPAPDQLVEIMIEEPRSNGRISKLAPSMDEVKAWRGDGRMFSHVTMWRSIFTPVVFDGPEPERVGGLEVTEDYLPLHGVSPVIGRAFTSEDMRQDAEDVILIGHGFWQTRFAQDPSVIGRIVRIDDAPARIIGVMPRTFYPRAVVWMPHRPSLKMMPRRGSGATVYARLAPGVTIAQAQQRLWELTRARDLAHGADPADRASGVAVESLYDRETFGYRKTTNVLAIAVTAILLIACLNLAGLLLARGASRAPELAVRASLGAWRFRMIRQLLVESVVLALLGGAAGILLARVSLATLVAQLPLYLPENAPPALNTTVLAFALGVSLLTGVLFGIVPALKLSRVNLAAASAGVSARHGSALSRRGGQVLIAGEVALAIVLLAGAGLMIRSFSRVLAVDLGFDPSDIVIMEVAPISPDPAGMARYYPQLVAAVRQLPGVEAVGAVDHVPLAGGSTMEGVLVGGKPMSMWTRRFLPGYFEAVGFSLRQGRFPSPVEGPQPLATVNESAARQMFPALPGPVGQTFEVDKVSYTVSAVIGDVRHSGPLRAATAEVFLSAGAKPEAGHPMVIAVRSRTPLPAMTEQLRRVAAEIGPRVVVERILSAGDALSDSVVTPRRRTALLGLLAGLGLVLALVGIFGMTAYAVGRRTREIGVRMALGATPGGVVRAIVRDAMWPVTIGIVFGLAGAAFATRVIESFLFQTRAVEPTTFAAVAAAMAVAGLGAAWIPARRAASVEVTDALRAL